ncbi:iron-sulfur cluster assembly scaffold protein [Rubrobacter tropicus]|uniref:iron-sulfur cluster assembly scaffold protein n=1 Tax=Rubrobacter tropicus TaxID=2653851 RepID=UPI001408DBA2|nr:iron-sulfur cluster assembly scaffold protein [Rubrobacter tropicus]
MDRKERVAYLVDHFGNPRHKGVLEGADVAMPGGSPECGGSVVVYLKGDGNGGIEDLAWTGQGDTISMGATSVIVGRVRDEGLTLQQVLDLDYEKFMDSIGRDVIGSRTRNATLGLSTIKSAVRKYQRDRIADTEDRATA